VLTAPFPYWHHFNAAPGADVSELVRASLYQVELLLSQQTAPSDTAAIIIEPVLGEGGYVPAPPAFLQGLRTICDKHGLLLIVDEVQSGFGRTGRMFNLEYSGVRPDIIVIAKVCVPCWYSCHATRLSTVLGSGKWVPAQRGRLREGADGQT
jgi:4-aminobutyrate aminotransferase